MEKNSKKEKELDLFDRHFQMKNKRKQRISNNKKNKEKRDIQWN